KDQTDAEAAIYLANMEILQAQSPYVTLIAAVAFGYDNFAARAELEGVFLAQQYVNQHNLLPSGVQARVLVLNSGLDAAGAPEATSFLVGQIKAGNVQHLVGIIGWPATDQTQLALQVLRPYGLAVLSPTASADNLGGFHALFFPMVPSDTQQGSELADSAVNDLGAQHLLVLRDRDGKDTQSQNTASTFFNETQRYLGKGVTTVVGDTYISGDADRFLSLAGRASLEGDDLIFLACSTSCDGDT